MGGMLFPIAWFIFTAFLYVGMMLCGMHPHDAEAYCVPVSACVVFVFLLIWSARITRRAEPQKDPARLS